MSWETARLRVGPIDCQGMEIAILVFEGMTALDAVGPYEVLSRMPGARTKLCGAVRGPVRTDSGSLGLVADVALEDVEEPDIVLVPGGPGSRRLMADPTLCAWIRRVHATSRWTASVCTGSLILGGAGILRGLRATGHWMAMDLLASTGAVPVRERVVVDGKIWTAAGVTAGIDMALRLAAREAGDETAQAIQLSLEYDPDPPFDAGSPDRAPAHIVERLRAQGRRG